jgi:hypothetical protein
VHSWVIWVAWGVFVVVALLLGFVGRHFSLRTLRYVAAVTASALVVLVTRYGLTHPANSATTSSNLANSFAQGADELSAALFHPLLILLPGDRVPAPGRIGWLIIAVLLVFGYRVLEAWATHREAPVLDTSALGDGQLNGASGKISEGAADGQSRDEDELVAQLKFRLSAMEVRAPAILPGGSRSNGLASIAEASGAPGSGLAGAIIRFFGMLWPNPRRFQVRVRVESGSREPQDTHDVKITVSIDDPGTGQSVATKTMVASNVDEAAAVLAGFVARHIFVQDPTTPPWCIGASNGRDLGAMLLAKQQRVYPKYPEDIESARGNQIAALEKAAGNNQCAGVARYELAQLYDLAGRHVAALRLHALNREQHPRFYRGRYRLSMSLEMIANPEFRLASADRALLDESLAILKRCGVPKDAPRQDDDIKDEARQVREKLLAAAAAELRTIRRQMTLWHVIWATFRHRDERVIRIPQWSPRTRQSFHDGLCVAELLVAIRQGQIETECSGASEIPRRMKLALRVMANIAGDNSPIRQQLTNQEVQHTPGEAQGTPETLDRSEKAFGKQDKTRWLPWQSRTPSWEAAYNTACVYAALNLDQKVVISLQRAISNTDCEMQRPWDWISHDPDFFSLKSWSKNFNAFLETQKGKDYPATINSPMAGDGKERNPGRPVKAAQATRRLLTRAKNALF